MGEEQPQRILVVDDELPIRRLVHRILGKEFEVLEAESASVAVAIASSVVGPIHLLITDVVMPVCTGDVLAKKLAETRKDLRVLYMSGYSVAAVARYGITTEDDFLQKPFTPPELRDRVRRALAERKVR